MNIIYSDCVFKTKPFEGAETEGTAGFLKGIGKGFVGYAYDMIMREHPRSDLQVQPRRKASRWHRRFRLKCFRGYAIKSTSNHTLLDQLSFRYTQHNNCVRSAQTRTRQKGNSLSNVVAWTELTVDHSRGLFLVTVFYSLIQVVKLWVNFGCVTYKRESIGRSFISHI